MTIPVVWSPETRRHEPMREVWVGVPTDGTELPERVDRIREALTAHDVVDATSHDDDVLLRVHDPAFVEHLRTIHAEWTRGPYDDLVGQDRVVPYVFPTPAMTQGMPVTPAAATHGRAGQYGYDTMTLVGPGTWEAARAAVDCALTAVDLVTSQTSSTRTAYALCRPPGHHATRQGYGGSCYLNNAAVAAQALRDAGHAAGGGGGPRRPSRQRHPGDLLGPRRRPLRLHPRRPGRRVVPALLRPRSRDRRWRPAREPRSTCRCLRAPVTPPGSTRSRVSPTTPASSDALVVSLGVDAAADDPESPLLVTADGYHAAGRLLGSLGVPAVVVQEGGYHLPTLGGLVAAYLQGHAEA